MTIYNHNCYFVPLPCHNKYNTEQIDKKIVINLKALEVHVFMGGKGSCDHLSLIKTLYFKGALYNPAVMGHWLQWGVTQVWGAEAPSYFGFISEKYVDPPFSIDYVGIKPSVICFLEFNPRSYKNKM